MMIMRLFLVQHGEAKSQSEDPTRPLSEVGLRNVEKVAAWMSKSRENVAEIWHSGKKRAEQTASIFGKHLLPPHGVIPVPNLNPEDSILPIANNLNEIQDSLMIAGHLPYLGLLASYLVTGDKHSQVIRFQNAGVVCLIREQGRWSVAWIVVPDLVD
jgi:phosphohistidine phosphatase